MADNEQTPAGGTQPDDRADAAHAPAKAARPPKKTTAKATKTPAKTDPAKAAKTPAKTDPAKAAKTPVKARPQAAKAPAKAAKKAQAPEPAEAAKKAQAPEPAKAAKKAQAPEPAEAAKKAQAPDQAEAARAAATRGTGTPAGADELTTNPPPGAWMEAAWEALWHADEPPQRLAELTVAELGPRAKAWVDWLRRTYPGAPAGGIARLATEQARKHSWALAAVDAAGPLAAAVHMPAAAGLRAMLVLRIAAAYDHDPTDPVRAHDLLQLLGYADGSPSPAGRLSPALYAVTRLGRRRLTPFGVLRLLQAASDQRDSLLRLAHTTTRHYRPRPARQ